MSASARAKKRELRKDNKTLIIMCVHVEVARPVCVCSSVHEPFLFSKRMTMRIVFPFGRWNWNDERIKPTKYASHASSLFIYHFGGAIAGSRATMEYYSMRNILSTFSLAKSIGSWILMHFWSRASNATIDFAPLHTHRRVSFCECDQSLANLFCHNHH